MILAYIGTVLCIWLVWLYLRWRRVKNYWAEREIPYLPPHPILGSLTFLQQINASVWLRNIYKEFKAPYAGVWYFWKPVLMVNSPDIARQILVKDSSNFRNRHASSGIKDPIGRLNIFTLNDPEWTKIRRRLTPSFTASKLRGLQSFLQSKTKELVCRIDQEKDNRNDARSMFADYTTDVIGTSAFGVESNATLTGESPLRSVTKEFMKFSVYRGLAWCSIFFWPELVDTFGFTFFPKSATDYFRKIFKIIAQQRQESNSEYKDLFESLIKIRKESAQDGEEYSEDFVIAQAAIFLQGGFDTTATVLTYLCLELAFDEGVQEKLYSELLDAKETNGSDKFETEFLSELPYLNCVIKEILRKYPSMGWMDRIAAHSYKIDENLTIPAGTPVLVNVVGMHHDPAYFPDPFKFDPDRFLPENEKKIKPFTYLPFGDGPRICIGARFSHMNMVHAVTAIVLNFKILPFSDTPSPQEAKAEVKGILQIPGEKISLNFVRRT